MKYNIRKKSYKKIIASGYFATESKIPYHVALLLIRAFNLPGHLTLELGGHAFTVKQWMEM